jgi:hypothetical protein
MMSSSTIEMRGGEIVGEPGGGWEDFSRDHGAVEDLQRWGART